MGGTSVVSISARDAQSPSTKLNALYVLLTPSDLGMTSEVIRNKLHRFRKKLIDMTESRAGMKDAEKLEIVKKFILSIGGPSMGGANKYLPVGMQEKPKCGNPCVFHGVTDNQESIVLMYAPGHLLGIEPVSTVGKKSVTKKSFMAKNMKHGQMLVTLSWGEEPSDLDLYVVAPAEKGATEIGGGKPKVSSALDAQEASKGVAINWMNTGDANTYPYAVLDTDAQMGFGPETITVHKPVTGTYKIYVDCYSCWGEDDFPKFAKSGATVRVFDRLGLKKEFLIKDAMGDKPMKYWGVAHRTCWPPPPLKGDKGTKKGFANIDNKWTFSTKSKFYAKAPQ